MITVAESLGNTLMSEICTEWPQPKVNDSSTVGLCKLHDDNTYVGVEVEVECVPPTLGDIDVTANSLSEIQDLITVYPKLAACPMEFAVFTKLWQITHDHSLRGSSSKEFIFRKPYKGKALQLAIHSISVIFSEIGEGSLSSPRCGTHVHINALDMTIEQLVAAVLIYVYMEPSLFRFCTPDRVGSVYTVPVYKSNHTRAMLSEVFYLLTTINSLGDCEAQNSIIATGYNALLSHWPKYSALNIGNDKGAIGTMEFRQLESTTDAKKLTTWINLMLAIRTTAISLINEGQTLETLVKHITKFYEVFAYEILPPSEIAELNPSWEDLYLGAEAVASIASRKQAITASVV